MKYARQCSVTKQGMNAGYVWSDGSYYCIDDDSIALTEFRKDRDNIVDDYRPRGLTPGTIYL